MLRFLNRVFQNRYMNVLAMCLVVAGFFFIAKVSATEKTAKEQQADISAQAKESLTNAQKGQVESSEKIKSALMNAQALSQDASFLGQLKQQQEALKSVKGAEQNAGFAIPEYFDEARNKRYLQQAFGVNAEIQTQDNTGVATPMILISFSMPSSQIKGLLEEARRIGAAVVLSGLYKNDFEATVKKIGEIGGREDVGIGIDPTVFERFSVSSVPFFILPLEPIKACTEAGCETPNAVTAQGSSTLEYFLETVVRVGTENEKKIATEWLGKARQ